jgi:hypothetical protein
MLYNGTLDQGVLQGWLNDLEVTDNGDGTVNVDTGASLNYGVWYENDAVVNVAITDNSTEWVVVRASWATQTSRLVAIAPGAFTQTAGVTYDIPLAEVTDVAGAITLITDLRDYCVFSTDLRDFGVTEGMIVTDAATTAKLIDQPRWFSRGAGAFSADIASPATWTNLTWEQRRDEWMFTDGVADAVWCTIRVPADISSANLTIDLFYAGMTIYIVGDVRWTYSIWQAGAGGVAANTTGAVAVPALHVQTGTFRQTTLISQPVTAGDVLHIQLARDGGHGADSYLGDAVAGALFFSYTADS